MLTIINRGYLKGDSFYDKMGMYWVVSKIIDDPTEYIILIMNPNGPSELFALKKENLYGIGYELGISAGGPGIQRMYKIKTYIDIETIRDKTLLVQRMADLINDTYDI